MEEKILDVDPEILAKIVEKRWVLRKEVAEDKVEQLSKALQVKPILAKLFVQRGIADFDSAKDYCNPALTQLHDPFLMKGMQQAVERIETAIQKGEKIMVYGDYDVDGTTSVACVFQYFSHFYPHLSFYIPDRFKEGYGISVKGVETAIEENFGLVIALDCGIKAVEQVQLAKEGGVDFIICDHHNPGAVLPDAVAILNPKQQDCHYPYKFLSGCGVGFKLLQAFHQKAAPEEAFRPEFQLDLVAVSTAADIVPMTGENRVMTALGIQLIAHRPRPGIQGLLKAAGLDKASEKPYYTLSVSDLVFKVAPRINAAGRLKSAENAVEALLSDTDFEAVEKAGQINDLNAARKQLDEGITKEALAMIEASEEEKERKTTVLFQPHWHKGVIGIVASRLIEKYYRPTIMLTESGGKVVGSARSVDGFNVYDALAACEAEMIQFGGHAAAAGMTIQPEKVADFKARFEAVVRETITDEQLTPIEAYDAVLWFDDINLRFYNTMERLAPFGPENHYPVFIAHQLKLVQPPRIVGNNHLRLRVAQEGQSRHFNAIGFGLGHFEELLKARSKGFSMCFQVKRNEWQGRVNVDLWIKDLKINT